VRDPDQVFDPERRTPRHAVEIDAAPLCRPRRSRPARRRLSARALLLLAFQGCTLPILNADPRAHPSSCPTDPIFGLRTPVLFAHRGGAGEVPESTKLGFCHAKCIGSDVLELDVRLTKDKTFVVWHGPSLDNVRVDDAEDYGALRDRRCIGEYSWRELEHRAWVSDPNPLCKTGCCDLSQVPRHAERELMTLETFLATFPCKPLNVEIKDFFVSPESIGRFVRILDDAPPCPASKRRRTILVASANDLVLAEFRRRTAGTYPTNIPVAESLLRTLQIPPLLSQPGRSLQVPPGFPFAWWWVTSMAHRAGSAVHVFITKFLWIDGLDEVPGQLQKADVYDLLDSNIDGIMTDRPAEARRWMNDWMEARGCPKETQAAGASSWEESEGECTCTASPPNE
jgi:glycerophosphoryl diester phosphodiesterase